MPKSTQAAKEQRVNEVYKQLIDGHTRFEILQYSAKHWKIETRQTDEYIAEANALIAADAEWHRPAELGKAKRRLDGLYQAALRAGEYTAAIAAQREINKLFSLYEPEAPKVLAIAGVDEAQLKTLADAIRKLGMKPSDVFESMLQELAEANHEQ